MRKLCIYSVRHSVPTYSIRTKTSWDNMAPTQGSLIIQHGLNVGAKFVFPRSSAAWAKYNSKCESFESQKQVPLPYHKTLS